MAFLTFCFKSMSNMIDFQLMYNGNKEVLMGIKEGTKCSKFLDRKTSFGERLLHLSPLNK